MPRRRTSRQQDLVFTLHTCAAKHIFKEDCRSKLRQSSRRYSIIPELFKTQLLVPLPISSLAGRR